MRANGSTVEFVTFVGGSFGESVGGLAVDTNGAIYVAGTTLSSDLPGAAAGAWKGGDDAFVDFRVERSANG